MELCQQQGETLLVVVGERANEDSGNLNQLRNGEFASKYNVLFTIDGVAVATVF